MKAIIPLVLSSLFFSSASPADEFVQVPQSGGNIYVDITTLTRTNSNGHVISGTWVQLYGTIYAVSVDCALDVYITSAAPTYPVHILPNTIEDRVETIMCVTR